MEKPQQACSPTEERRNAFPEEKQAIFVSDGDIGVAAAFACGLHRGKETVGSIRSAAWLAGLPGRAGVSGRQRTVLQSTIRILASGCEVKVCMWW